MRGLRKTAYLVLISTLGATLGVAQSVNVTVAADDTRRIVDERIFGANATMWDDQIATPETITLLRDAGLRIIRIPGGSLTNQYHWRVNKTGTNTWTWAAGFPQFVQVITELNAQAFASVNYGTGTPEEAAAWVAYANASATLLGTASDVTIGVDSQGYDWKTAGYWSALRASAPLAVDDEMNFLRIGRAAPVGIKHWEIGNENYGSWETDEQAVKYDPYTYAVRTKDYLAKMRAVDPTIKVGVVVITGESSYTNNTLHPVTNPRTGVVRNGWTPVLLATLKSIGAQPDFAVYHRYDQSPAEDNAANPENDAFLLQSALTWPNDAADLRQQFTDFMGTAGASVELMVTENNSVYAKPGKQTVSLVNALFLADSVSNLLRTEFNALTWWAIRNGPYAGNNSAALYGWRDYGDYGLLSRHETLGNYDTHPTYYAMKLLSRHARGGDAVVSATSNNALLSAYAVRRTDQSLSVLVINKSPTATQTGNFTLSGHLPAATATTYSYGIPQDEAARTGTGSHDIATGTLAIAGANFSASFAPYSLTVISIPGLPGHTSAAAGGSATLTAATSATNPAATFQWQFNGADLAAAATPTYTISNAASANAGLYTAVVTSGTATTAEPAIFGVTTMEKVIGAGEQLTPIDIPHPNGNIFDQVLLTGAAESITADTGQVTRTSFIDLDNDLVQVEFSGPGTLSIVLDSPSGPAAPINYNQPTVGYMKGHAGIVITGADERTNVGMFSVGRATAFDRTGTYNILQAPSATNVPANNGSPLFEGHQATVYGGAANLAFVAISTTNGNFGGLRMANARFSAAKGLTGVYAPGVRFNGPVVVGDIEATGTATPVLMIGSGSDVRIAGGDLDQPDDRAIRVSGFTQVRFTANIDSHGNPLPALANQGRLTTNGADVTTAVVVNP